MYKTHFNIPGTISFTQTSQLVVSSGIPSLDKLLGGGLPVGTATLIEEDTQGTYARIILKYFLAEGAVNKHDIFVATQEIKPQNIVTHLPALVPEDRTTDAKHSQGDKMKIAFRYSNLPTSEPNVRHEFGHYFDLSSTMSNEVLEKINIHYWSNDGKNVSLEGGYFKNPAYRDLLEVLKMEIENGKHFLKDANSNSNILKIGIYGLGSPLWMSNCDKNSIADLNKFLYCLKALLKSSLAVALITIPTHLYDKCAVNKFRSISDISLRLQALAGTELEHNKYLSDYHGYFHIDKMSAINTFVSKHPGAIEHMFKLRRKKFTIEVLHLPPDLEVSQDKKATPSLGCASNTKHLLEF